MSSLSRRSLLQGIAASTSLALLTRSGAADPLHLDPLDEFTYDQIETRGVLQHALQQNSLEVLMGLSEDSLLKPFREMAGQPAPGDDLGGWYAFRPNYDPHHDDAGLAPGSTLGQWVSALARFHAASRFNPASVNPAVAARVLRLNALLADAIAPAYFAQTRFPGYSLDKLVCGLLDSHRFLADPSAFATLDKVTAAALPSLPGHAVDREVQWKLGADISYMWDESYTLPENLFLASAAGAAPRYREMARAYLDDTTYFEPLSHNQNVLADKHAYSYVNALCSAMQAYFILGSEMHLRAARNGFAMLQQQSFATGGWGPDELLRKPGYDQLAPSLTASHNGFETPCGSYAHMKLTRYLLRATRDGLYGDSMESILHNALLGVLPLQPDGRSFYSSDYNYTARRVYSVHRWPCCSGTLPQAVADLGVNTWFRSSAAVWVNLYQPSALRWLERGTPITIEQTSDYPLDTLVKLRITSPQPVRFSLHLRIPAWTSGPTLKVNGVSQSIALDKGFTALDRTWRNRDLIELNLPMSLRLEPLPANGGSAHPRIAALLRGPLVLFALRSAADVGPLALAPDALLAAHQTGPAEWSVNHPSGTRKFVPFIAIGDREYSTYVALADTAQPT